MRRTNIAKSRVINSKNETVGFLIEIINEDGYRRTVFMNKNNVLNHIKSIRNLKVNRNGIIRASKKLEIRTLKELNKQKYNSIVKNNVLEREIYKKS